MANLMQYVYLVSTPFSGSTLLALLMDAHPEVASVGEVNNAVGALFRSGRIERYLCSCGVQIECCPFWKRVQRRCAEQGMTLDVHDFDTDLDTGLGDRINQILFGALGDFWTLQVVLNRFLDYIPAYRQRVVRTVNRNLMIAQAVCDETQKSTFFDASKKVWNATLLLHHKNQDFKLIHLVRDPRGVMNSYRKHRGDTVYQHAARYWKRVQLATQHLRSCLPQDAYLLVKYEQLCANPVEILGEICRFLNVEVLDLECAARGQTHHLIGNQMRLQTFTGLQLDEAWRHELTPAEISRCLQVTADVIKTLNLGYT
jgi:hypothetical protein